MDSYLNPKKIETVMDMKCNACGKIMASIINKESNGNETTEYKGNYEIKDNVFTPKCVCKN